MAKRYRMTPRRRAALKKAQVASARKRRRRRIGGALRAVGTGAAFVGGSFVAYHTNRYIARPDHFIKETKTGAKAIHRVINRRVAKKVVKKGTPNVIGYL